LRALVLVLVSLILLFMGLMQLTGRDEAAACSGRHAASSAHAVAKPSEILMNTLSSSQQAVLER
jgi:hypothetical protein